MIKKLIAYSSVAHMGFVTIGIFCLNPQGLDGAIFQMISHGLISGALFLAIGVIYERTHTRDINSLGNFATKNAKIFSFFNDFHPRICWLTWNKWFYWGSASFNGLMKVNPTVTLVAGSSLILGAIYMLRFYKKISFGVSSKEDNSMILDVNNREYIAFLPLAILVLLLGIFPNLILIFFEMPNLFILNIFDVKGL